MARWDRGVECHWWRTKVRWRWFWGICFEIFGLFLCLNWRLCPRVGHRKSILVLVLGEELSRGKDSGTKCQSLFFITDNRSCLLLLKDTPNKDVCIYIIFSRLMSKSKSCLKSFFSFFLVFLLHSKNYYNLSLQVTFSNAFDNLWKPWRVYAQWHSIIKSLIAHFSCFDIDIISPLSLYIKLSMSIKQRL